jgi:hypothetical protein
MAIAITVDGSTANPLLGVPDTTFKESIYQGTFTLTGNYGTASSHGDTLSFSSAFILAGLKTVPLRVEVYQQPASGTAPGNCSAVYCPGTTRDNGVVSFANAGTELTGGSAYTGAASTAVWKYRAWFAIGQ